MRGRPARKVESRFQIPRRLLLFNASHTHSAPVIGAAGIERAFTEFAREPNGGVIVLPGAVTTLNRGMIAALAVRHRLPAIYPSDDYVRAGGLMAYGTDLPDQIRKAATYVDRILRGEKPADLPIQQPTKFSLIINLNSAKAIGLAVPDALLVSADEVIE